MTSNFLRRQNGWIAGVCGGLAAFFGLRPIWFRVLFLFLALPGGFPGVLTYLIFWIAVPKLGASPANSQPA